MTFLKHHWFGLILSLFMLAYLLVFVLVLLAPRYDVQKRGFIPCTETMAEQLIDCDNGAWCMLKTIVRNGWCDAEVIGGGFRMWLRGEQKTPWANYLFEPEQPRPDEETEADESLREFYAQTPDIEASMQNLRRLNRELELQIKENEEKEIKEWFKTINIVGIPLNEQELRNAIYSGEFVTAAKRVFSNSQNAEVQKWSHYVKGDVKRQEYLAEALKWVCASKGMTIDAYMSQHRRDASIGELENYFRSVIDWVSTTFTMVERDMCGLEWGRLYETYHKTPYSINHVTERVLALQADESIKCPRNIYEYILGGEQDKSLLQIRLFEESTKRAAYTRQTEAAKEKGISNCPLCAIGDNANKTRIYKFNEMDADHVTAWSKGGATSIENCEMLCKTHNRSKGNK